MSTNICRIARCLLLAAACYSGSAPAAYVFNSIDYPGATFTETFGINNSGQVAVNSSVGTFVYQGGAFVPLPAPPTGLFVGPTGLNDAGAVVGAASDATGLIQQGFVLSGGVYRFFTQPGWLNSAARAINNAGIVTGFSSNADAFVLGGSAGFIYDPAAGTYATIVPPPMPGVVIAQGINAAGQVVGSYGQGGGSLTAFLREPDGTLISFRVNGYPTAARGINDTGLIVGRAQTPSGFRAFVGNASGFELLQCPASVCPGVVETFGQGINNAGQIVGGWNDAAGRGHGFIATPASLPTGTTVNGAYTFNVSVVPNTLIFIDPAASLGFDYEIGSGDPKFAAVQLPIGVGDSRYTVIAHGKAFAVAGGELFAFAEHGFAKGVAQFRVVDIEADAGLDPNDAAAFPTGLVFTGGGTFTGTMTPLCRDKPMPAQANASSNGRGLSPCFRQ